MDFSLNEEQRSLQETVKKFAKNELTEIAKKVELEDKAVDKSVLKKFSDLGILGVNLPKKYGGGGMSHLEAVLVLEEVAKISIAIAFPIFESSFGPALAISNFASEELRNHVLPKICSGEIVVAVSMSEPQAGSALTDLTTNARIEKDHIVINGQKRWCSGAGHADGYVVYCRLSDEPGSKGIGAVYIEKETNGFTFGKREHHMGFRGVHSADMYFDNVRISKSNIIVPAGGFKKLMEAFDLERCGNSTMSLACAQSSYDYVLNYVQERKQFGKAIIDFQAVQLQLAEMKMKLDASRLLIYRAVVNADKSLPSIG